MFAIARFSWAHVVEHICHGLPGPVEDAFYRTAQEALSNARKHAAGAPVRVLLAYRDGSMGLAERMWSSVFAIAWGSAQRCFGEVRSEHVREFFRPLLAFCGAQAQFGQS